MFWSQKFLATALSLVGMAFAASRSDLKVGDRTAIVYNPTGYKNPPLVISMHGMGIPASYNQGMMMFEKYADTAKDKFITVYPQGVNNQWDLGSMKDVNFITAIIDSMYKRYGIDKNRVYVSGFSMGGMMSCYLTCKIPDKIAAAVPGDGFPLGGMSGCSETRHVPVLHIHGNADDFVKYTDFVGSFLPAQLTRYGCPAKTTIKPYPASKPTSGSYRDNYASCVKNGLKSEIDFITVDGMIHDWATPGKANANDDTRYKGKPFDIDGTQEAWNFMKQWSLNGGAMGVLEQASRASGAPVVSAWFSDGRIRIRSDLALREVRVLDLQGKTQATWSATDAFTNELAIPVSRIERGIYLLEATGDDARSVANLLVP